MVERETLVESAIAAVGVALFVAVVFAAGILYGGDGGDLSQTGGYLLVGGIVVFVVGMSAVGYLLSRR